MPSKYIVSKLQAILGSDHLVEAYLRKFGEIVNEQYIEQIKKAETQKIQAISGGAAVEKKNGDDPVYEILCQCPVCYREEIVSYHLRSKSQTVKETIFLVPQYSAVLKYFAEDFNLLQTTVCPECLFASPDPRDWSVKSKFTGKIDESQLSDHTKLMSDLRNHELNRKNKFPAIKGNPNYFARPRSYERAIESIELSIMRAELEVKHALLTGEFKIGSYYLKIADIKKKQKKEFKETLKIAEKYFSAAAIKSELPSVALEMLSIYQVIALNLYLGDKTKAAEFMKIFKAAVRQKEEAVKLNSTSENKAAFSEANKWNNKVSNLWEYREDPDFWKDI